MLRADLDVLDAERGLRCFFMLEAEFNVLDARIRLVFERLLRYDALPFPRIEFLESGHPPIPNASL